MSNTQETMRGRDVAAPVQYVVFDGQRYPMKFSNRAARIAEDVYAEQFNRDIGYYAIITELSIPKHRALMALVYASIVAGGTDVAWEEFEDKFSITDIDGVAQAVRRGVIQSMPEEDPEAEDDEKNAGTTPTKI